MTPTKVDSFIEMAEQQQLDNRNEVARVSLKLPPFWKLNPKLWFCQVESQFVTAGIISEVTKFHYVVAAIESDILQQVSDIILTPPTENMYSVLKARLEECFSESEQKKLQRLLTEVDLGDKKPSHLLREMKELSAGKISEEVLKSLWLQRLPNQVRAILTASGDTLDRLVVMADKICETVGETAISQVSSIKSQESVEVNNSILATVHQLKSQMEDLTLRVAQIGRGRSPYRFNSQERRYNRSSSAGREKICWYHRKFGKLANRCLRPCDYSENE